MKTINTITSTKKTILVLFIALAFQSCSSSDKKHSVYEYKTTSEVSTAERTAKNENAIVDDDEAEHAAALLLLAIVANEINNSSVENYSNNDKVDYDGKDYDEGTEIIRDHIECELGSQIIYE